MKKNIIVFILLCLTFQMPFLIEAEETVGQKAVNEQNKKAVNDMLRSAKNGDTANIYSMMTGPLRSRYERLMKDNKNYDKVLRNKFYNSNFIINNIEETPNGDRLADVTVYFRNGKKSTHKFLMRLADDNTWKFADEIFD